MKSTFAETIVSYTLMEEEDQVRQLQAELDGMLRTLALLKTYNSLGKTLLIDEEISKILKAYNR